MKGLPRSSEECYALHKGSFEIDDPRPRVAAARYTFFVPPPEVVAAITKGDWVKAIFRPVPADREYDTERMWVKVEEVLPDGFAGKLDSEPFDMPQLVPGADIFIPRDFVIDVDWDADHSPPASPERREYWERCMVDDCVAQGRSRADYLYREEPDLGGPDDKYPDSGWRIRGTEEAIAADEEAEREPLYIALGAVLNQDDRWLHLIDEPVGEAFRWSEEGKSYIRLDPE